MALSSDCPRHSQLGRRLHTAGCHHLMYCAVYQGSAWQIRFPSGSCRKDLSPWFWGPTIRRARPSYSEFKVRRHENHCPRWFVDLTQNDNLRVRYRSWVYRAPHATTTPIKGGVDSGHKKSSTTQSVAFHWVDDPSVARWNAPSVFGIG